MKNEHMLRIVERALPIIREVTTILKDDFSDIKLVVVTKRTQRRITGTDWMIESWEEREKNVERIRTIAKRAIGKFKGFNRKVIFLSITTLIPHSTSKSSDPITIRICFGNVKKSVVMARKNKGNNRKIVAVRIVATDDTNDNADLFIF